MVRTPIPKEHLKYYKMGYGNGFEECLRRLRQLGIPEEYLKRISVKHKHRCLIPANFFGQLRRRR